MATTGLLALLDDITALLDDVAAYSKLAAQKSAGVLGDDLALNAQQVGGVRAERELPVVWAVAKGSFWNKVILVPAALVLSAFLPQLVTPLLMLGGLYLCYEGVEKLTHPWLADKADEAAHRDALRAAASTSEAAVLAEEAAQVRGAIRTDFILSAEIVVIALSALQPLAFWPRAAALFLVAFAATAGVYGLVAAIVKLDDLGLALLKREGASVAQALGRGLLAFAPRLMALIGVLGTAAMFLVGGSILVHGFPGLGSFLASLSAGVNGVAAVLVTLLLEGLAGVLAGALALVLVLALRRLWRPKR